MTTRGGCSSSQQFYERPASLQEARLFGTANAFDGVVRDGVFTGAGPRVPVRAWVDPAETEIALVVDPTTRLSAGDRLRVQLPLEHCHRRAGGRDLCAERRTDSMGTRPIRVDPLRFKYRRTATDANGRLFMPLMRRRVSGMELRRSNGPAARLLLLPGVLLLAFGLIDNEGAKGAVIAGGALLFGLLVGKMLGRPRP